jgi:Leucine-rich repeat (LRR) protein
MEHERGDEYIRRISTFIRTNERALAEAGVPRRRRNVPKPIETSVLNPLGWFGATDSTSPPKPVNFVIDTHHLFYVLMRLEDVGVDVGTLDVKVDNPSKPMNYINIFQDSDKSDTLSLASFRSSLSTISGLSLGGGWWGRPETPTIDAELKYIYSSFTKLPALILTAPGPKMIAELASEPPNENCLPLDSFKNLQTFECTDIDPRTVLGWDRMSESLRSLTIKRSGLEDVSDIFIGAVLDDQGRREGTTSRSRQRRISGAVSKHASFYSTRLPDTVPEANEESTPTTPQPPAETKLPSYKWAFLRHLSLSDNALTFLPTDPLPYLTTITHLDLSSNLLVSVPPGLSALFNLVSLNLSDNMIDSVLGIYTQLGQILFLNLSHNRLESICGLERLLALERVDLQQNAIDDTAEIGRLAMLPHIADVCIEGNPFVEIEENYRITCFDYFWKEGKNVTLDGTAPGFYERRGLSVALPEQMSSSRPMSKVYSPPVVAVGSAKAQMSPKTLAVDAVLTPAGSSPASGTASLGVPSVGVAAKERRRKNKRIVDLTGEGTEPNDSSSKRHARTRSETGTKQKRQSKDDQSPTPSPQIDVQLSTSSEMQADQLDSAATPLSPPMRRIRRSRHNRRQTEGFPSPTEEIDAPTWPSPVDRAATLSSKSAARRRMLASVYEPANVSPDEVAPESQTRDADAYRRRIEALRSDMGEGWLKVFNQSQMGSPGVASG